MGNRNSLEDRLKPFQDLVEAVDSAREADALLQKIWAWIGPYGADIPPGMSRDFLHSKDAQKLIKALAMPDELRYELQRYFGFDDSE